jgi:hypothetical protein
MDTGQCIIKSITPRLAAPPVLIAAADTSAAPRPVKKRSSHKTAVHSSHKTVVHKKKLTAKP